MPSLTEANVRHLLRRTEFVDRPHRVARLMTLGSIGAAVDDVMDVRADPPRATLDADSTWRRGQQLVAHWMGEMAHAERPFGERMAFFWHGHLCSELGKVNDSGAMQEQIDLFRRRGLGPRTAGGNVADLVKATAVQIAMLRYLDNVQNFARSPNQNFARELMELFLLGVGNYTEADVEAATAAWTGHTQRRWDQPIYEFHPELHDTTPLTFLGRPINRGEGRLAGNEVVDVILGPGRIPVGPRAGATASHVAADFLSRKLWQELGEAASGGVPTAVATAMRAALVGGGFDIRPWVRALLTHDDFYADATKTGLVRQPVEFAVALMVATGSPAHDLWMMGRMGQELLYPPNVSGWRPNGYWVNASTMAARQRLAQGYLWLLGKDTWRGDDGYLDLPGGRFTARWMREQTDVALVVDRVLQLTNLTTSVSPTTRAAIVAHLRNPAIRTWQRDDALLLALSAPDLHIA